MNITKERLKQELVLPSRKFSKLILEAYHSLKHFLKRTKIDKKQVPTLIWDIRSNPITFDFIWLIIDAYNYFRETGFSEYDVVIFIPHGYVQKPFSWNSYDKYFSSEDLMRRIKDMIIPIAESFNCVRKVKLESDIEKLQQNYKSVIKYPRNYDPLKYYPNPLKYSKAVSSISKNNKNIIPFFESKIHNINKAIIEPYVTLTLRDHGYSPTRNCNQKDIDEFLEFALSLNAQPVIVPDDIEKLSKYNFPKNIILCKEARTSLAKRISLYSKSKMNIFPPSGPFYVSLFLKNTKSVMYNIGVNWDDDESPRQRKVYGYKLGDQPYTNLDGRLIWHAMNPRFTYKDLIEIYFS